MINIENVLYEKFKKDELAHFYILSPSRNVNDQDFLTNWVDKLLQKILETKNIINHEDFLEIKPEKVRYALDDFNDFFYFLNYKATRSTRKFMVIHDSERFTNKVSNKLLKTLEEPPIKSTIFLLNPTNAQLLQTISSRGINLRILPQDAQDLSSDIEKVKELAALPIHKIIEKLKGDNLGQTKTLLALTKFCTINSNFNTLHQLQTLHDEFKQDRLYNNPATHRLYALANLIKDSSI